MNFRPLSVSLLFIVVSGSSALQAQTLRRYDHGDPTNDEQLMLELVNRARADPGAESARVGIGLNEGLGLGGISKGAKAPLAFHPALLAAARNHTRWMLSAGKFSHEGEGGSTAGKRMTAAGYVFSSTWTQAENISFGSTSGQLDMRKETLARYLSWFKSPPHRKNMFGPDSRDFGVGMAAGPFKEGNAVLATQDFASSGSYAAPMVLGVVFADRDGDGFYGVGEGLAGVTVTPEGGEWKAVTSASGGYAVPYSGDKGSLTVTFSGGAVGKPVSKKVERSGGNVKVDLISTKN